MWLQIMAYDTALTDINGSSGGGGGGGCL